MVTLPTGLFMAGKTGHARGLAATGLIACAQTTAPVIASSRVLELLGELQVLLRCLVAGCMAASL